jgi:hypothetical protein
MKVGGYRREVDLGKLGPTLIVASSLVLAIRTARWPSTDCATASTPEWDAEAEQSISIARQTMSQLISRSPSLFHQRDVPWYQSDDEDVPK